MPSNRSLKGTPPSSSNILFRASLILSKAILLAPLSSLQVCFLISLGVSENTIFIEVLDVE